MFHFKQFSVQDNNVAMKVGTDGVLLGSWADVRSAKYCLDIGTGSGLLALMVAQRNDAMRIDAIDIDETAVDQATENVSHSPWQNRINVVHTDIAEYAVRLPLMYDLIICNPPYFSKGFKVDDPARSKARVAENLSSELLMHAAQKFLSDSGKLAVIFPVSEGEKFLSQAPYYKLYCKRKTYVWTKPGKAPARLLMEFVKTNCEAETASMEIETADGKYSEAFKNLTSGFYLNW